MGDSTPTSDFLISLGDKTGSAGTFYLGRAFSLGDLSRLLTKMGISTDPTLHPARLAPSLIAAPAAESARPPLVTGGREGSPGVEPLTGSP